ncbi:MAG: hypothetical protein LBU73_09510 [Helicobacteraceae bacterium]|nr:hypothetical protein [Helicobacteraceae bacterium]
MKKRSLTLVVLFMAASFAIAEDAPRRNLPPVPDVGVAIEKNKVLQNCKVSPQIVNLPPMVEADYRSCANAYFKPDMANTEYRLGEMTGSELKVESIAIADGFVRAYEISANVAGVKKRFICDEKVNRCVEIAGADYRLASEAPAAAPVLVTPKASKKKEKQ